LMNRVFDTLRIAAAPRHRPRKVYLRCACVTLGEPLRCMCMTLGEHWTRVQSTRPTAVAYKQADT
jgi:hypothetical protein